MKRHPGHLALLAGVALALLAGACSDSGPSDPTPGVIPPRVMTGLPVRIVIDPALDTIREIGGTKTFQAVAVGENDQLISGVAITWHTLNPGTASVGEATGSATALANGTARITATAGDITAEAILVVDASN